jgi:tripartite-type tricarboxylate transporter receptor subunit TctC
MHHFLRRRALTALCAFLMASSAAWSQTSYPNKPIKLIIPFAPGQVTDWLGRFLGEQMAAELGQPVVVENKAGLNGTIGTQFAAGQPADGYTLVITSNGTHVAAPSLYKKLGYDPIKQFTQIHGLMSLPWVLMVRPDFPAKTLDEFIAYVRQNPGKFAVGYGSSSSRLCIHLTKTLGKVDVLEVPYKGLGQTITDTIGGQLQFTFLDMGSAMSQAKGGNLRPIAVTSPKRSVLAQAAQIPAMSESLPGYQMVSWLALGAPAGLPADITDKLQKVMSKILSKPENRERIAAYGGEVVMQTSEQIVATIKAEQPVWAQFVKEAGIEPE